MALNPAHNKVRRGDRQAARHGRNKKRKAQGLANRNAANDFLKHSFLPVAVEIEGSLHDQKKIEQQFFASLKNLAMLYSFDEIDVNGNVYPYNIVLAYEHAAKCLKEKSPSLSLIIAQDEDLAACLATIKTFNTRTTLYYIDVKILHGLLKQKRKKKITDLMLSIFSYLYQIVHIPFYMDEDSYLYYCYERIATWLDDEPDERESEHLKTNLEGIALSKSAGDIIRKQISDRSHIILFEKRLKGFEPRNDWEKKLLETGRKAFALLTEYGLRSITDAMCEDLFEEEPEERIRYEQYVSFYWDDRGWLADNIFEQVNIELQELGTIDEPITVQLFDKPQQKEMHDLDFAKRLFGLLDQLCETIITYRK